MAEKPTESTGTSPAETPPETGKGLTVSDLRNMVTELVKEAVEAAGKPAEGTPAATPATPDTAAGRSAGIADEVKRQVERIQARDKRAQDDKAIQDKLTELSEKTAEKPPIERRRVHRLMGWGEPPQ